MYHPTRGGVRGGRDQFSWENVKTDKDREYYLGHSVMAPVGRWQQGKDVNWYSKDGEAKQKAAQEEFNQAKEMEERALMAALGYRVSKKEPTASAPTQREHERDDSHRKEISSSKRTAEESKGPQSSFYIGSKRELDKMLIGLLNKYGKEEVYAALDAEPGVLKQKSKKEHKKSSSKKSKKHKRKHVDARSDKSENESESDSSQDSTRKRKHRENKHESREYVNKGAHSSSSKRKSKHDDKSRRSSSSSSSQSESN
jgi:hypothetical protein